MKMKSVPLPHDLLVAFLLVQNAMDRRSDPFFLSFGLTAAQFNILNLLALHDGPLDQLALTERLLVGKSSISIVLNRMVKAELIARQDHAKDRRQVVLILTRKGRMLWRKVSARYEQTVEEIFGAMPEGRREAFLEDLGVLFAALKREDGATSPSLQETLAQLAMASKA